MKHQDGGLLTEDGLPKEDQMLVFFYEKTRWWSSPMENPDDGLLL